ncbi:Pollen allergen Che a 1-like protein [Drosera capensis]
MAKSQTTLVMIASLVYFLSLISFSQCHDDRFFVEGQVYCDTCRAEFVTRLTEFLEGAKVRLECRNITGGDLTYTVDAVTDSQGRYSIAVDGDYEDDICEILLLESPKKDCSEIPTDPYTRMAAKIPLTSNNGVVDPTRNANPLGFMINKPLPECPEVFKELGLPYN